MSTRLAPFALIVATKDRPADLGRLLASLETQTTPPAQIVVVDGGTLSAEEVALSHRTLNIRYVKHRPPSAAGQRNRGIHEADRDIPFIGFLDDDTEFEADAMDRMVEFWRQAPPSMGGAAFNLMNHPPVFAQGLKSQAWAERMGLYSRTPGIVLPSGFHTMIGTVAEDLAVKWIPTTAAVWRRPVLMEFSFDEWFRAYGYIEDLDLSYRAGKKYGLAVIAAARYRHFPSPSCRVDHFSFGKKEVEVRLYFVRKHPEFSIARCRRALGVRMTMSFFLALRHMDVGYLKRAAGNFSALIREIG